MEHPTIIRFHIRHYQNLLTQDHTLDARQLVSKLLNEAEAELPLAEAAALNQQR